MSTRFYSVWDTGYVLFCFFVTLFCIIITWVVAGIFYKNKSRLGELCPGKLPQQCRCPGYRLYTEHLRKLWHGSLMIVGTVPLYNIAAVLILSFTGPDAKGLR